MRRRTFQCRGVWTEFKGCVDVAETQRVCSAPSMGLLSSSSRRAPRSLCCATHPFDPFIALPRVDGRRASATGRTAESLCCAGPWCSWRLP